MEETAQSKVLRQDLRVILNVGLLRAVGKVLQETMDKAMVQGINTTEDGEETTGSNVSCQFNKKCL